MSKQKLQEFPETLRCQDCIWRPGNPDSYLEPCHRNAPGPNGFALVRPLDFCGQHISKVE